MSASSLADVAVVFPGQGSQAPAMGAAWRDHSAWHLVERAETVVGRPLAPFLLDPERTPASTADVQLSVFLTSMLAWEALRRVLGTPAVFAGHSLGQIGALTAAGVLDFDAAVRVVLCRGEVTADVCRTGAGGMVAVLGLDREHVAWACSAAPGECWVANDNAPGQVVLAGTEIGLARMETRARKLGARKVIRLAVAGPFHTPLMLPAARRFGAFLRTVPFSTATTPVISNADVRPIAAGSVWSTVLVDHLIQGVRWRATQQWLVDAGVRRIVEVGFGTTLTSIAKRSVPDLAGFNVDGPAALANLAAEFGTVATGTGGTDAVGTAAAGDGPDRVGGETRVPVAVA